MPSEWFRALSGRQVTVLAVATTLAVALVVGGLVATGPGHADEVDEHGHRHGSGAAAYAFFAAASLWAVVYLRRLGRPDGSPTVARDGWYPRAVHVVVLVAAVLVGGFATGKSPNPMEGAVKVAKALAAVYPTVWPYALALAFFVLLAVVGNKAVCGWACPFGALQELVFDGTGLASLRELRKKVRPPAWLTVGVRTVLFAAAMLVLFGVVGGRRGYVLYHPMNPFNIFEPRGGLPSVVTYVVVAGALVGGVVLYRPFCQFICPFGLVAWLAERVSWFRTRVNRERCVECGACGAACPTTAADDLVARRTVVGDCFSCGRCLGTCPLDAIGYHGPEAKST